ncbi:(2Fe-2S)-binding protein [Chelatococcus sp. SYSU_G07232]|uniref:(2Fe-2S)-binding protein n=1 Tax=Chelatococcus albus TaxID=3047466 RepID=A0ABT7AH51_9HYPH|nr:(2Fe-2S)-binding protein [Chelatococcus sp. SYSU_G07232]MDJ1158689.1 (2Fe-2S)-binding protein [Chelatococcus sp. SYSU_G07232]
MPILTRLAEHDRRPLRFMLDGRPCIGREGDTVLTAVLTEAERLRLSEFSGAPRAGFCLMGACQDCWIATETGECLRACTTFLAEGMRLLTDPGAAP